MVGVVAREVEVIEMGDGAFVATVELIRVADGQVIGRGSSMCGLDESVWKNRPRYARRSMAVSRACGRACRLAVPWIMQLVGYDATLPFPACSRRRLQTGRVGSCHYNRRYTRLQNSNQPR
jgi:hypothetical protein